MDRQVRFETSGALGILTLANPPLNLFSEELIEDLRGAVTAAKQTPLRALLVRAGSFGRGNGDILKSPDRVAVSRELNSAHIDLSSVKGGLRRVRSHCHCQRPSNTTLSRKRRGP
jgi:hypothetical protein